MLTSKINPDDIVMAVAPNGKTTRVGLGTDPGILAAAIAHARDGNKVYTMPRSMIEPTPEEQRAAMMKTWEGMLRRDFQTEARRDFFELASMQCRYGYDAGAFLPAIPPLPPIAIATDCGTTDEDIAAAGRLDESTLRRWAVEWLVRVCYVAVDAAARHRLEAVETLVSIVRAVLEAVARDVAIRASLDTLFEICIVCASAAASTLLEIGLDPAGMSDDVPIESPLPIELE